MAKGSLRETALAGIENTEFFPAWGKQRLHSMIANQFQTGLYLANVNGACHGLSLFTRKVEPSTAPQNFLKKVAKRVEKEGLKHGRN